MAGGEPPRGNRDDLAALHIDRRAAPRRRRVGALALVGIALVVLLGVAARWFFVAGRTLHVRVVYAQRSGGDVPLPRAELLTGSGYVVTADRYISLGVRVASRIDAYLVEVGERVEPGQALVQLDPRPFEAVLRESEAAMRRARADVRLYAQELERARELHRNAVASDADLDLKRNRLAVAQAEVARLEAQAARLQIDLDDTVVRAPTGGVILEKFKEVGEIAVPGGFAGSGELIRMANLDDLRAELDVNEADLSRIVLDQPARVVPEAYPERSYEARVVKLYPQINRQKGTLRVEVKILEPDAWLRPDMSVRIAFLSERPVADGGGEPAVVLAHREAVRSQNGAAFAWVVSEGRLRKLPLELAGDAPDGRVLVASGLAGGEALVVGEASGLREGQRVEVLGAQPPVGPR